MPQRTKISLHTLPGVGFALLALLLVTACEKSDFAFDGFRKNDPIDRSQNLTRDDYRDLNKAEKLLPKDVTPEASVVGAPPIPDVAQIIAAPRPPKVANNKLVSIAVTDDVPLRDVLFELGRLANVDIEIGPGLDQRGVNLRATDKPFNEVIERISDLAGLRYAVKNGSLRVEEDTPYFKNYSLGFLNMIRSSSSNVTVSSNVLSASVGGGGSSGGESGSSGGGSSAVSTGTASNITSQAESDLWSALTTSIGDILRSSPVASGLGSDSLASAQSGSAGAGAGSEDAGTAAGDGASAAGPSNFSINRQAGVLSVNASERQHDKIATFLSLLERNSSAQVLIEAKIVEVTLSDQFLSGVDWSRIVAEIGDTSITYGNYQPGAGLADSTLSFANNGAFSIGLEGGSLESVLQLTQRFGTTRTLSSPRLHAINNQQSVLTFAQNRVVQSCDIDEGESTTTSTDGGNTSTGPSITCTVSTIPVGIVLNILPSINLDTQEVTLNVRPTLSRQVAEVDNVGTKIAAAAARIQIDSKIPVVEVREIDSVMKIKSGAVMVIGGLMEDSSQAEDRGVPGVSNIPWLGNAFKSKNEAAKKRELIIFIKATVVNSSGSASAVDRGVYEKYTTDPRPLF